MTHQKKSFRTKNFDLRPRKSLGQHFLTSPAYLAAVAGAAEVGKEDTVLEIGPGEGALTKELLSRGARVIAVEKDHRLVPILKETFAAELSSKQLTLIEADALEFNPTDYGLESADFKLVANIPYYITGALIKKYLGGAPRSSRAALLVQKEVAERIARDTKESVLSLSVKAYGVPRYVKTVPRGAFRPAPGVDSAILAINDISGARFKDREHEQRFFELLHAGFGKKRKLLKGNLAPLLGETLSLRFASAEIAEKARAEDVPLSAWLALSRENGS